MASGSVFDRNRLLSSVRGFSRHPVLVLGDMVADEYIIGRPDRISREAPVLVLHHGEEFVCPGGAANVAYNLARLGAPTRVAGVIGCDSQGAALRDALDGAGIDTSALMEVPERRTATKTRIVGRGEQEIQQQIVRVDRVDRSQLSESITEPLLKMIDSAISAVHGLVISDYENGVISQRVIDHTLPHALRSGIVTTVDSHGDLHRFQGVTVATPNQPEAESTLHRTFESEEEVTQAGEQLREEMHARGLLLTRGSKGMILFEEDQQPRSIPPSNLTEVFDPTGAGDTVSAVFTLALLTGAGMAEAAVLSNIAAGEVVKKLGAAALASEDLIQAVEAAQTVGKS